MAISVRLSRERVKNHMAYSAWKYIVLIACSIFIWDMLYTTTAYRPPESKRVDVYIMSPSAQESMVRVLFDDIWQNDLPDMELVQSYIMSSTDYNGDMQLSVYMGAGEGDVYILPSAKFKNYASNGAFLPLGDVKESGALNTLDIDLAAGYVALVEASTLEDDGEVVNQYSAQMSLYGIPLAMCEGLPYMAYVDGTDLVLAVTAHSGNEENVIKFVNSFLSRVRFAPPEALATAAPDAQPSETPPQTPQE